MARTMKIQSAIDYGLEMKYHYRGHVLRKRAKNENVDTYFFLKILSLNVSSDLFFENSRKNSFSGKKIENNCGIRDFCFIFS